MDLIIYTPPKDFGGYYFGVIRPFEAFPSVRPSRFSFRTHIFVMDFQIVLSFYRNMNLHMRTAHTRFCCTALTGNRVMAFCYFQIYIVDRSNFCPDAYLGYGFSDFIIPCRRIRGGYCFDVVCPSFLFPSGRPAMDYGKLTKGALWSHLPPTTDNWESGQLLAKIWGKHWLWHPCRSLMDWLPLKWPKNNGVKPQTDNK